MSVHPARVETVAPVWMGKMASVVSVHLAPCLLSAYLRITPVPTSPAVTEFAMMHPAGEAPPQLLTCLLLSPWSPATPDCLLLQVPLCV